MYKLQLSTTSPLRASRTLSFHTRRFSSCPTCPAASPLFHLQAFSNQRESRWLAKSSGLSPVEHSAQLQLIRSSEGLDPYEKRKRASKLQTALRKDVSDSKPSTTAKVQEPKPALARIAERSMIKGLRSSLADKTAIGIGKAVLARHAAKRITFKRKMRSLEKRSRRLYRRLQERTILIVLSIAAATGCGVWAYNREKKIQMREKMIDMKLSELKKQKGVGPVTDSESRLDALYTTPEVHELLEWQRALGAQEAIEAHEVQSSLATNKSWWHRIFWS